MVPDVAVGAGAWARELRKGILDLALLCHLGERDAHGYALIAALKSDGIMPPAGAEATVYQALQRLARQGFTTSEWIAPEPGEDARPRKMYRLTPRGLAAREAMRAEWNALRGTIDKMLERTA